MNAIEKKRLYWLWFDMKSRCLQSSHKAFSNYGGRGISVCADWLEFETFLSDMGARPKGGMLERINNDLGYSKQNCKWATRKEQNSNRRNCIYVEIDGSKVTLKEACRMLSITYRAVHKRLCRGWDIHTALTKPIGIGNTHG